MLSFSKLKNELNCDLRHFYVSEKDFCHNGCIIYGGGFHTINNIIPALNQRKFHPEFIIDSDEKKWGNSISGIEIKSPDALYNIRDQYIIVSGTKMREMALDCIKKGAKNWIVPSAIKHFCWSLGELGCSYQELYRIEKEANNIFNELEDDLSREIFYDCFGFMSLNDIDLSKYNEQPPYFSHSLVNMIDYNNFLDIGAFNGDTLDDLISYLDNSITSLYYYGIEVNHENVKLLAQKINEHRLINSKIFEMAASDNFDKLRIMKNSLGHCTVLQERNTDNEFYVYTDVETRPIDSLGLPKISVIKEDIEGSEMAMLNGCVQTIRKYRPTLIISTYHRFSDMISIPSFILSLKLDYKIFFRHHSKYHADTVCYAIAK